MSGLATNLKSTRPRPGHNETKAETETKILKIGLETFITAFQYLQDKEHLSNYRHRFYC